MVHSPHGVGHSTLDGRPVDARRYRPGIFLVQGESGTCHWLLVLVAKERLDMCYLPHDPAAWLVGCAARVGWSLGELQLGMSILSGFAAVRRSYGSVKQGMRGRMQDRERKVACNI